MPQRCVHTFRVGRGLLDPHLYPCPAMPTAPTGAGLQANLCDHVADSVTSVPLTQAEAAAWSRVWLSFLSPKHLFVMQGTYSQSY